MIDAVFGLEAEHKRRIAVLLEDDGGHERGLQAMSGVVANDLTKGAKGLPLALPVVGQPAQVLLDLLGSPVPFDDSPLFTCEGVQLYPGSQSST